MGKKEKRAFLGEYIRFGQRYYCEICQPEFANDPAVANINLSSIEHHCKYKDPERHKAEILARISGLALMRGDVN